MSGNECKCPVEIGFYIFIDPSNSKASCRNCHRLCKTCFGPSQNECTSCRTDTILHLNEIQQTECSCIIGYSEDLSKSLPTQICQKCEPFCAACDHTTGICKTCLDNEGVQLINSKCMCSKEGYFEYLDPESHEENCVKCHPLCKSCIGPSSTQCMECFTDKGAIHSEPLICACMKGFFYDLNKQKCEKCDAQCSECYGPTSKECNKCNLELALSVENHNSWCVSDCDLLNSVKESYFTNNKSCKCIFFVANTTFVKVCNEECEKCIGPIGNLCLKCRSKDKVMSNFKCIRKCPEHFYQEKNRVCYGIVTILY